MGGGADGPPGGQLKKLIEAGYLFAKGSRGKDGLAEDAKYFNLPESWLKKNDPDFYVHYECWDAFQLFQSCMTQWRISPMGDRIGLDYTAVVSVAQFMGHDRDVFQQVRYLELGAMMAYGGKDIEALLDG